MNDTGKFKSSQAAAQANAGAISGAIAVELGSPIGFLGKTNLTVINNMKAMKTSLSACNTDFVQLVENDSESILKLAEFFMDHDESVATVMGEGSNN